MIPKLCPPSFAAEVSPASYAFFETRIAVPSKPTGGASGYTIERQTPPKQDRTAAGKPPLEHVPVPAEGDVYALEADAFAAVVAGDAAPFVTAKDSIGNLVVIETLQAALL